MRPPDIQTIEGQRTIVIDARSSLPKSMPELLTAMAAFGFRVREDFTLAGTRPACEAFRTHRFRPFREGRWWNPRTFAVVVGDEFDDRGERKAKTVEVESGIRFLRLLMCADCGAVQVRDISPTGYAGARPATIVNQKTGETRIAPAVGQLDMVIGWYSGKRRAGREYK